MPFITRNNDEVPEINAAMLKSAKQLKFPIVQFFVIDMLTAESISFAAVVAAIPRMGEQIVLENGVRCDVILVSHVLSTRSGVPRSNPKIYCRVAEDQPTDEAEPDPFQ
jgi:hypothetical protein